MKYHWRIELRYRWGIFWIHVRKNRRMTQLWIAGKLVKLAFWISSDLQREMGYR